MDSSAALPQEGAAEANKRAELLFNELHVMAATLVPIPSYLEAEDQSMDDENGGRATRRRIFMKSGGLSDSANFNGDSVSAEEQCL